MKDALKHTFNLALSNFITRGMAMLFFILLARSLSVSEYGLFRYLITLSTVFGLVFSGIPTALTKFLSENKNDWKLRSEYLSSSIFLLVSLFLLLAAIILLFSENKLFLILFIFAYLIDMFYIGFARGLLDYLKLNGFKLVENTIQLAILVGGYLLYKKINLAFGVVFYSLSGVIALVIFEFVRWELKISLSDSQKRIGEVIKFTVPVTLGTVGWTILLGISSIYIEKFNGIEQVGYFSVSMTLMQTFSFLPDAIFTLLMPKVAELKDKKRIVQPLKLAVISCLVMVMVVFLPLYYYREFIIRLLFSEKYLASSAIILPLAIGQLFLILNQIYGTAFQGLGKPGIPSVIISLAAGVNLILGFFLTRSYGILGASYSLAISSIISWLLIIIVWQLWVKRGGLEGASFVEKEA